MVATLLALIVVGTSFPAAALYSQHRQLASAAAQLSRLKNQNLLLSEQQHQLNSKAEIGRLARQDYQLVSPGQSLYNVLPSNTASTSSTASQDPGNRPVVSPANAPDMSPDPGLPRGGSASGSGTASANSGSGAGSPVKTSSGSPSGGAGTAGATTGGFWARITNSLEFWK